MAESAAPTRREEICIDQSGRGLSMKQTDVGGGHTGAEALFDQGGAARNPCWGGSQNRGRPAHGAPGRVTLRGASASRDTNATLYLQRVVALLARPVD